MATIPDAVRRSMQILATHRALFGGTGRTMSEADIGRVIGAFEAAKAAWVLVGAHAVAHYTKPRATVDFDFIVEGEKLQEVLPLLSAEFGDLGRRDLEGAVELSAIDVDLIPSTNHELFAEALARPRREGAWNVPRVEVLIALKFLAAINPVRDVDRREQDIVDLRKLYRAQRTSLDRDELLRLGGMAYPDAEAEFREPLHGIESGRPLKI